MLEYALLGGGPLGPDGEHMLGPITFLGNRSSLLLSFSFRSGLGKLLFELTFPLGLKFVNKFPLDRSVTLLL